MRIPKSFPGQKGDRVPLASFGSAPGPYPRGTGLERLQREVPRRDPDQMFQPLLLTPFDAKEQHLYSEPFSDDRALQPVSTVESSPPEKHVYFSHLYLESCSLITVDVLWPKELPFWAQLFLHWDTFNSTVFISRPSFPCSEPNPQAQNLTPIPSTLLLDRSVME